MRESCPRFELELGQYNSLQAFDVFADLLVDNNLATDYFVFTLLTLYFLQPKSVRIFSLRFVKKCMNSWFAGRNPLVPGTPLLHKNRHLY